MPCGLFGRGRRAGIVCVRLPRPGYSRRPRPGLPAVIPPFSAQAQRLGQNRPGDAALGLTSTAPRPGGVLTKPLAPIVAATRLELNSMPAFETEAQRTAETEAQRTDGN